jgi:hypothetical protein
MEGRDMKRLLWILLGSAIALSASAQEISLRHDLDGKVLDVLATLVLRFNDELKGKGKVVLQDARGLENKACLPHLALLDPDDSMDFFATRPRFRPLHEVMREAGQKLDAASSTRRSPMRSTTPAGGCRPCRSALSLPVLIDQPCQPAQGGARSRPTDQNLVGAAEGRRGDLRPRRQVSIDYRALCLDPFRERIDAGR